MVIRKLTLLPLVIFLFALQKSNAQEQATQADDVVNSIGVNTHFSYTNTYYYQKYSQTIAALQSAGIRHIRDGYYNWPAGNQMYTIHNAVAAAGIGADFVIPLSTTTTASDVATFKVLAKDVELVEAPNEFDLNGGSNWKSLLLGFLPTVTQIGSTLKVPVLGPSLMNQSSFSALGNIASKMTYNNLHIYFGGRNPGTTGWGSSNSKGDVYGSIAWWLDNAAVDAPGVPSYVTETGYDQVPVTNTPYVVPESVAAVYSVQTVFEMLLHGINRSYIYELMDDPSATTEGIMNANLTPKLAYTAMKSLTGLLSDPGPSFTPGKLQYTLTGATQNVQQFLMQKRDGSFYLALWVNASIYNPATNKTINLAAQDVTLTLDSAHGVQSIYNFQLNGTVVQKNLDLPYVLQEGLYPIMTIIKIVPTN
jgi:hypothetical protein